MNLPHYCMWHRLPAEDVVVAVGSVLRLVQQGSAPTDVEERIRRVASVHAAEIVTDDFKSYFQHNVRSAAHHKNQVLAASNPSVETRAAQSANLEELRQWSAFEARRSDSVKQSTRLSTSSSVRMKHKREEARAAAGKRKFHALRDDETELAVAATCPWCDDDALSSEDLYKNKRLLCGTCSLSCYVREDRRGTETRTPQARVLTNLKKTLARASVHKKARLESAVARLSRQVRGADVDLCDASEG